jgi:starch-binding outer membrane protein, SusD/RagB family
LMVAAASLVLAACHFDVTNPGPVQEKFLDDPAARTAIVNGAGRGLSDALNHTAYITAAVTREIFPDGSTGSFGISTQEQIGHFIAEESSEFWNPMQQARWMAEDGARRFMKDYGADAYSKMKEAAQVTLWAGYANRMLGETMCDAVFDGGPKRPYADYLSRADSELTSAMTIASAAGDKTTATAAQAARASVRMDQGRWTEAVADATAIADNFVFQMPYYITDSDQYNRIYWATANSPYRAHTVYNTFYMDYYTQTKDPRVPWTANPAVPFGDAAVLTIGKVPWYAEQKYNKTAAGINLSTGWEMRLIEAEAKLRNNDIAGALASMNKHRVALGLQPWTATTAVDAWTALKRERGIEMWMEARRLNDIRRWKAGKTPGAISAFETPGDPKSYLAADQSVCIPISIGETNTNLNHPATASTTS